MLFPRTAYRSTSLHLLDPLLRGTKILARHFVSEYHHRRAQGTPEWLERVERQIKAILSKRLPG
jgi:hypothetical protein